MSEIFWVVFDERQKEISQELLATFAKDSKDELGLMAITIALSNLMFPGTSVLHTRLRYIFLVGWMFKEALKSKSKATIIQKLHYKEKQVRKELQKAKEQHLESFKGILGATKIVDEDGNADNLSQPPFNVYFNLLKTWGIIKKEVSLKDIHLVLFDDQFLNIIESKNFKINSFLLTTEEKEYLYLRIPKSLLKDIIKNNSLTRKEFIDLDISVTQNENHQKQLLNARNFSVLMWGSMLYYNYFLGNKSENLKEKFAFWKKRLINVIDTDWKPEDMFKLIGNKLNNKINFINEWFNYVKKNITTLTLENPPKINNKTLLDFLEEREKSLKGDRARLTKLKKENKTESNAKYGIHPIEYRWGNIKTFIKDFNATN
jgi:hypothetical protein